MLLQFCLKLRQILVVLRRDTGDQRLDFHPVFGNAFPHAAVNTRGIYNPRGALESNLHQANVITQSLQDAIAYVRVFGTRYPMKEE